MENHFIFSKMSAYIQENNLILSQDRILLGISGGADSTAMLLLLWQFSQVYPDLKLAIVCVDHGLREESIEEVTWVKKLADKYHLPFFTTRLHLLDKHTGLEERAREQRYIFLQKIAQEWKANKIAIAHHRGDQAETVLFRMLQGTGIAGLTGILPKRKLFPESNIELIRPLLSCDKTELLDYLHAQNQDWCEDISNTSSHFTRNWLRNIGIPFLQQKFPTVISNLILLAHNSLQTVEYMQKECDEVYNKIVQEHLPRCPQISYLWERIENTPVIRTISCCDVPIPLRSWLLHMLARSLQIQTTLRQHHYQSWEKIWEQNTGKIVLPEGCSIQKTPRWIHIFRQLSKNLCLPGIITQENVPIQIRDSQHIRAYCLCTKIPKEIAIQHKCMYLHPTVATKATSTQENHSMIICGVYIKANPEWFPLKLGYANLDQKVQMLGSPGKHTLRQIFSDMALPLDWRDAMLVLYNCQDIPIWIPGIGISEEGRIHDTTDKVWCITIQKM